MRFHPTEVEGVVVIEPELIEDERGWFARLWCADEFAALGLADRFVQINASYNHRAGTIRGLHRQVGPDAESKLVRCTAGSVWDVAVDIRPGSPTYGRHFGVELTSRNRLMLLVPPGCLHGYQSLEPGSEVWYPVSRPYAPASAGGARYDDPAFAIPWPVEVTEISANDLAWPAFDDRQAGP